MCVFISGVFCSQKLHCYVVHDMYRVGLSTGDFYFQYLFAGICKIVLYIQKFTSQYIFQSTSLVCLYIKCYVQEYLSVRLNESVTPNNPSHHMRVATNRPFWLQMYRCIRDPKFLDALASLKPILESD